MTFTLALSQAPQASYLNGVNGADSRQYYLGYSQHTPNGPRIAAAVAGMVPGEFREVWADASDYIFRTRQESTGADYWTPDWTPRAVWHEPTQQIILGGRRGNFKFYAYSDITGDWREFDVPADLARQAQGTVHYYGMMAQDSAGDIYLGGTQEFNLYHYQPDTHTFAVLPTHTTSNGNNGAMIAWAPDANGGNGGLFKLVGDAQRFLNYDPVVDAWTLEANGVGNDRHALLDYSPAAQRFLALGGSSTPDLAHLIDENGVATPVTGCPTLTPMGDNGSWIAYHPAGCWLVRCGIPTGDEKLYACWPNAAKDDVVWQDLGTAPDAALLYPTAAVDYTRGLIYIVSTSGIHAYKFPTVTDPFGDTSLTGASLSVATANGAMTTAIPLTGASVSLSGADGNLSAQITLSGAAIGQALAAAGLTTGPTGLEGTGVGLASGSGEMSAAINLFGAGLGQSTGAGDVLVAIRLAGAAVAEALGLADLSTAPAGLAGHAPGAASAVAALQTAIPLQGAATVVASGAAALGVPVALSGAAAAVASGNGELLVLVSLSGAGAGMASGFANVTTQLRLDGAALVSALASASLSGGTAAVSAHRKGFEAGRRWGKNFSRDYTVST